ncbi:MULTISPECIES: hypothetical protein [Clostridium]|uniref:Uncharacterized protein n=1 Tax=Clostridium senegalense TaxID=1465809 RepID=A0A6M0H345_9CLOT|nr:hypothetical protein [Clostridium senegalense]NEU05029.1 hypothetical protein [Clostridium senegalense]
MNMLKQIDKKRKRIVEVFQIVEIIFYMGIMLIKELLLIFVNGSIQRVKMLF